MAPKPVLVTELVTLPPIGSGCDYPGAEIQQPACVVPLPPVQVGDRTLSVAAVLAYPRRLRGLIVCRSTPLVGRARMLAPGLLPQFATAATSPRPPGTRPLPAVRLSHPDPKHGLKTGKKSRASRGKFFTDFFGITDLIGRDSTMDIGMVSVSAMLILLILLILLKSEPRLAALATLAGRQLPRGDFILERREGFMFQSGPLTLEGAGGLEPGSWTPRQRVTAQ